MGEVCARAGQLRRAPLYPAAAAVSTGHARRCGAMLQQEEEEEKKTPDSRMILDQGDDAL